MADLKGLVVAYDAKLYPISAICSACGEEMLEQETQISRSERTPEWIQSQFELHKMRKHSREDVNQAAARIVRKAAGG